MRNLLILFVFAAVLFSACEPTTDNNPSGLTVEEMTEILQSQKWRYDYPRVMAGLDSLKPHMNPAKYQVVSAGVQRVQFGTFEFAPDNIIWLDLNNGNDPVQGNWAFTEDGKHFMITFSTQKAIPHPIINFSKEEIHVDANSEAGAVYPKIFIPLSEGAGLPRIDTTQVNEGGATQDTLQ
ncbi:MAG: hypothetical protein DWQ02_23425 [Bacteroidetes bacterium]|nr:MAG: hypothetical protein DWQ02_23425 [Bacteroidota bacterium]